MLRGNSIDLKQAALGSGKYFVVIPDEYARTHRGWLRLAVTAFAKAFKRWQPPTRGPQHRHWRHIVIDEFANLGEMTFILNEISVSRGYSLKYHLVVQDLSQLDRAYRSGWESFVNNSFQRFFAVGDLFTAQYVSRLFGEATVQTDSYSTGTQTSRGASYGYNQGWKEPRPPARRVARRNPAAREVQARDTARAIRTRRVGRRATRRNRPNASCRRPTKCEGYRRTPSF